MVLGHHRLYQGEVYHHRKLPREHRFRYSFFMFYLDLGEIPALQNIPFIGVNRFNLFSFHSRDYLISSASSSATLAVSAVKEGREENHREDSLFRRVEDYLKVKGVLFKEPRFFLLTHLRFLGYVFNPVSFYYCYDGETPICGLAEVHNTFGERKIYLLSPNNAGGFAQEVNKDFYVSPFSHPHTQFRFQLTPPGEKIKTIVDQSDDQGNHQNYFHSYFSGDARPLSAKQILSYALRYVHITFKVTVAIHWEAFRLWLKKIPHFSKDANLEYQSGFHHEGKKKTP